MRKLPAATCIISLISAGFVPGTTEVVLGTDVVAPVVVFPDELPVVAVEELDGLDGFLPQDKTYATIADETNTKAINPNTGKLSFYYRDLPLSDRQLTKVKVVLRHKQDGRFSPKESFNVHNNRLQHQAYRLY